MITAVLLALSGSLSAATVVTVNGVKIDSSDVERRAQNVQTNSNGQVQDSPELREYIVNELITEQLVVQEAKRLKLDKSDNYKNAEADALKQIKEKGLDKQPNFKQNWADYQNGLLMMVYADNLLKQKPVTEQQVQAQYNKIKARYHNTDEVQLSEILTNKAADAEAALKELNSNKKFADVAKKYSMKPNKNQGGLVPDYVSVVDLKDANALVHQAVGGLSKGQFTKTPLKEGDVSLILYVNDKRKISVPEFAQLKNNLKSGMENEIVSQAIDTLGKNAKIVPVK